MTKGVLVDMIKFQGSVLYTLDNRLIIFYKKRWKNIDKSSKIMYHIVYTDFGHKNRSDFTLSDAF